MRRPITASRGARLTVHLHIPFLQQLYRATTARFCGMNSPLNATPVAHAAAFCRLLHAPATGSADLIHSTRRKVRIWPRRYIRKRPAMIRSEKRGCCMRLLRAAEHVESGRKVTSNISPCMYPYSRAIPGKIAGRVIAFTTITNSRFCIRSHGA